LNINFKNCFSIKSLTQCRIIRPQLVDKDSFQYQIRLYLLLFVGGLISYLRYVCLPTYSSVQHILCCAFALICLRLVSRVANGVSFTGLSIFDCPSGILWRLFTVINYLEKMTTTFSSRQLQNQFCFESHIEVPYKQKPYWK
jgi:hypothetical protein